MKIGLNFISFRGQGASLIKSPQICWHKRNSDASYSTHDNALARSGSAITNVVRNLVKCHPGLSTVITSHDRQVEVEGCNNIRVDFTSAVPRGYFNRVEMRVDHAFGFLELERPFTGRLPLPAIESLSSVSPVPDVIFIHEGHYACSALSAWRKRFPNCGLFLYVHTHLSRSYTSHELRKSLSHLDGVICVSDYIQGHIQSRLGKAQFKLPIVTVLNGVDINRFNPPSTIPKVTEVLFVGQTGAHKGIDLAVAAAALTQRPIHLQVIGNSVHGPTSELDEFERGLRASAKVAESRGSTVTFKGYQAHENLPEIYRKSGVVLVPSRFNDPCPLVCLEALASGAAVVASNRGGIPSQCASAALIVEPTPETIATALDRLIESDDVYRDFRVKARERAISLSWPHQYEELISKITQIRNQISSQ